MKNTNKMIRTVTLVALGVASFVSVPAAGPFQIRRATTAQAVGASPPLATITTSPFDAEPIAAGGTSYYYGVYAPNGNALDISVQSIPATQTMRIGFDDANGASAPVDASLSSVTVAPSTVRADGLQFASVTIVPRDAQGFALGRGLAISIDASLLWPAQLSGPIVDLGDGTYRAFAVSSIPGIGSVRVDVESVSLSTLPTITAVETDPSASLRDRAISQLQGLTGPGGPLSALVVQAGAGTTQANAVSAAISRANAALATLANDDPTHDDNVLKIDFDAVLSQLASVLAAPGALDALDVRDAMDDLLGVARLIAEWHIERAGAACGVCDGSGNPRKLCDAMAALASGDAMRAAISPDYGGVVDAYARAVERSLQAVQAC